MCVCVCDAEERPHKKKREGVAVVNEPMKKLSCSLAVLLLSVAVFAPRGHNQSHRAEEKRQGHERGSETNDD